MDRRAWHETNAVLLAEFLFFSDIAGIESKGDALIDRAVKIGSRDV